VASIGVGDDVGSFDQRLAIGAQQLFQPRVCLSLCRTSDLGSNGRLLLVADAPPEIRDAGWGALLRSQHQHAVMSAALHLNAPQAGERGLYTAEQQARDEQQLQELRDQVRAQTGDLEKLKNRLRSRSEVDELPIHQLDDEAAPRRPARRSVDSSGSPLSVQASSSLGFGRGDEVHPRASNDKQRDEIKALSAELEKVKDEANSKIDAANERIRALRRDRDEARAESTRLQAEARNLDADVARLRSEMRQIDEQKEDLLGIVEDLHQACVGAGLESAGRESIDSIAANSLLR